jgi:hypothetical protein
MITTEIPDGETIRPICPSMFTTIAGLGAEASVGDGTTHGYGMPVGAGAEALAGAGVGTILGDGTAGAGAEA